MSETDIEILRMRGSSLTDEVNALVITDAASFERAGGMLLAIKGFLARVAALFDPIDRAQIESRKVTIAQRKALEAPALALEATVKSRMVAHEQEQARIRREAEAIAEKERVRLEEEARLQAALEAEARGDVQVAENILEAPHPPTPVFTPPALVPAAPKAEGVSFRDSYRAEVTDLALLVKAVAAGEAPIAALLPNLPMLNQMARAMKEELRIPGVRVIAERVAMVRT